MMLKKQLKTQMKGGVSTNADEVDQDDRQEMNELIESDPELYAADVEEIVPSKKKTQK